MVKRSGLTPPASLVLALPTATPTCCLYITLTAGKVVPTYSARRPSSCTRPAGSVSPGSLRFPDSVKASEAIFVAQVPPLPAPLMAVYSSLAYG